MSEDTKAKQLPECGSTGGECPDCKAKLEMGFGLAGGGYGPYEFCDACRKIVTKSQEKDDGE